MINRVVLVGRLTKDPELRYTAQNVPVATFTIAVPRQFTNQTSGEKGADFIPIVIWRNKAENVKKYLFKGSLVAVEGRIQTRNYDDKDGSRRYVTEVLADNAYFLDSKGSQSTDDSSSYSRDNDDNSSKKDDDFNYDSVKFTDNDLPF